MLGAAGPPPPLPGGTPLPTREELAEAFPGLEIGEMIGHGGMGAVFRARQPKLERDVALKVLPRALAADPSFAERFHREARALARLNHPNIVTVHDYGEQGGWFYLLMELVDGVNLRQAMRTKRFSPEQALEIVPQICAALQYAHGEGVLHRDIKPENLLLDTKGRIKIADFGIAKLGHADGEDVTLTLSGARLGTVAYMAPEQIEHPGEVDHRADIYSLGVVFYEMLTGELPIGRFAAPSEKSPVGAQVDEVVFRTLEKSPERRFQSAGEMQTKVETLSGQAASPAPPPPPPPPAIPAAPPPAVPARPVRWCAGPAMAVSLLVLAGVFGLIFSLGMRSLEMAARRNLDRQSAAVAGMAGERAAAAASAQVTSVQLGGLGIVGGVVIGGFVLTGTVLGWKNLRRLRLAASPRRGLVAASVAALLPAFIVLWMLIAINIRDEPLAWLDGITLTAMLLVWFGCWMNPRPLPWNAKAVLAVTLIGVPLLCLAHGWRSYAEHVEIRWAQEMNLLQTRINELQNHPAADPAGPLIQGLVRQLDDLHLKGRPTSQVRFSSGERVLYALAAGFALASALLGWMARAELRREPATHRGRGLALFACWFWPLALVPVLLLLS